MGNLFSEPLQYNVYGWKRDIPDKRDQYKLFQTNYTESYVTTIDLRKQCPPVYNQGKLGSCTAQAIAAAFEYNEMLLCPMNPTTPSRLFIYYNERYYEGTTHSDAGANIRDGIKSVVNEGICPEYEWEYDISQFKTQPPQICYDIATHYKCIKYKKVKQELNQLKSCLIEKYPIICGISVYDSFDSDKTCEMGVVTVPKSTESLHGGHAILLVGYDDNNEMFIFRNSWGDVWGDSGYGYIPYEYITDEHLASDFWIIEEVTESEPEHISDSDTDNDDTNSDSDNSDNDNSNDTNSDSDNSDNDNGDNNGDDDEDSDDDDDDVDDDDDDE